MAGLSKAIAQLQHLRRKFETLLASARKKPSQARVVPRTTRLWELTGFCANPGNLRAFVYVPARLPKNPGLVVALHGCTQTADDYDHGTGWSTLADRLGFVVVYPQQQPSNNAQQCFSWFVPGDIARDCGEAFSIRQMVEHAVVRFGVDRRKVFVTGLSAGGAMASVLLATYPEVFAGGAIIAGLPYGCAASVQEAFDAMFTERIDAARALGDRVRAASRHQGPWPRISVWHGSADAIVRASNAENIIRQWINVYGLDVRPSLEEQASGHTRRIWNDAEGKMQLEAFSITGMAHGVPINPGRGDETCGAAGPFFLDVGISSSHRIATFWGLCEDTKPLQAIATREPEPAQVQPAAKEDEIFARTHGVPPAHGSFGGDGGAHQHRVDTEAVIAAALKAAGLPVPEFPSHSPGTTRSIAPGPIIAAALKVAGLVK
jgi:poly(hydroxyalkanoate) depolymerase family esterase